ncbi:MAG: helicase-related protein [Gaiellaceae bacterium]
MLLLTATPMQLHDYELYSMIELVEPGLFNGYGDFESSRAEIAAINRAVTALRSQRLTTAMRDETLELLERYKAPPELGQSLSGRGQNRAAAAEWLSRCHRLSLALVRNRKAEIGGFTKRIAHRIDVSPDPSELKLQDDLLDYIRQRYSAADPKKRTAVGLVLVAFQKMLCSSSQALAGSLETRLARLRNEVEKQIAKGSDDPDLIAQEQQLHMLPVEDVVAEIDALQSLARRARRIQDAKLGALDELVGRVLSDPTAKVLIFSQFLESIEMIRARLATTHSVRVFHGGMSREEKDAAHEAFRHGTRVLVASEAGGEGRNFQFCHIVVNYDLPWNPMKIEQRIGRVDRVGQTRDVEIYNFAVRGMLDERILNVLEHRIRIFIETVGALDPILESFEEEVGKIALGERGDQKTAFARLDTKLNEQIANAQQLEDMRRDFVLDWRSLQRDEAARVLGRTPRATREDLEHFCRTALRRFPVDAIQSDGDSTMSVRVPGVLRVGRKNVDEDYRGTFDVQKALVDERMHFFAMGHPLVESIIDNVGDPWWLPVTVFESPEWTDDKHAFLVDYRLELHGTRESGTLFTHLVTEEGVKPAVRVLQPDDALLEVALPPFAPEQLSALAEMSRSAARHDALTRFEEFKIEHAALVEQERERLVRMYDSRRGFVTDRIARNRRELDRIERFGTPSQKRIIPARQGQITADQARLKEFDAERRGRVKRLESTLPSHFLRLLSVALIVRPGKLKEMTV